MGLIQRIVGGGAATTALGNAATNVAEVFIPNATKKMELSHKAYVAALDEHGAEFQYIRPGFFDRLVNGLNRMPRPMLALGTLGLFVFAMVDPIHFAERMVGLNYIPEPLWWLLGAIVSFYFGAREAHYFRGRAEGGPALPKPADAVADGDGNAALAEWRKTDKE